MEAPARLLAPRPALDVPGDLDPASGDFEKGGPVCVGARGAGVP